MTGDIKIDDLVCVWGFDVVTENKKAFFELFNVLEEVANRFKYNFHYIATNIKETRLSKADWARHYHGAALASVALVVENRYENVFISSSDVKDSPWGSTPLTDVLFSTKNTNIINYGSEFNRVQKIVEVSKNPSLLNSLKVCAVSRSDENCSYCSKCYRTMINLELVGALDGCSRFDSDKFSVEKINKIYIDRLDIEFLFQDLISFSRKIGRKDIEDAIIKSLLISKILRKFVRIIDCLDDVKFFWRFHLPLKKFILRNSIT